MFGLDSAEALRDSRAPRLVKLVIDGRDVGVESGASMRPTGGQAMEESLSFTVPYQPRRIVLTVEDESGISDQVRTAINTDRLLNPASVDIQGTRGSITVEHDEPIRHLVVLLRDGARLANGLMFELNTAPPAGTIPISGAGAGMAVKLLEPTALLRGEVALPKGEYELNVISRAFTESANSLWMEVDGKQVKDAIHIPLEKFGNSSRSFQLTPELPRLTIEKDGKHAFVLTLREGPGPELDKVQFLRAGKVVAEFECEALLGP